MDLRVGDRVDALSHQDGRWGRLASINAEGRCEVAWTSAPYSTVTLAAMLKKTFAIGDRVMVIPTQEFGIVENRARDDRYIIRIESGSVALHATTDELRLVSLVALDLGDYVCLVVACAANMNRPPLGCITELDDSDRYAVTWASGQITKQTRAELIRLKDSVTASFAEAAAEYLVGDRVCMKDGNTIGVVESNRFGIHVMWTGHAVANGPYNGVEIRHDDRFARGCRVRLARTGDDGIATDVSGTVSVFWRESRVESQDYQLSELIMMGTLSGTTQSGIVAGDMAVYGGGLVRVLRIDGATAAIRASNCKYSYVATSELTRGEPEPIPSISFEIGDRVVVSIKGGTGGTGGGANINAFAVGDYVEDVHGHLAVVKELNVYGTSSLGIEYVTAPGTRMVLRPEDICLAQQKFVLAKPGQVVKSKRNKRMKFNVNDRVKHLQAGRKGTVLEIQQEPPCLKVAWDAAAGGIGSLNTVRPDEVVRLRPRIRELAKRAITTTLSDGQQAAWRIAATQVVRTTRGGLAEVLKKALAPRHKKLIPEIMRFLATPAGEALLAYGLAMTLQTLPLEDASGKLERLRDELRIGAMTGAGNSALSALTEPMMALVSSLPAMIQALPDAAPVETVGSAARARANAS